MLSFVGALALCFILTGCDELLGDNTTGNNTTYGVKIHTNNYPDYQGYISIEKFNSIQPVTNISVTGRLSVAAAPKLSWYYNCRWYKNGILISTNGSGGAGMGAGGWSFSLNSWNNHNYFNLDKQIGVGDILKVEWDFFENYGDKPITSTSQEVTVIE